MAARAAKAANVSSQWCSFILRIFPPGEGIGQQPKCYICIKTLNEVAWRSKSNDVPGVYPKMVASNAFPSWNTGSRAFYAMEIDLA
jgi:hypothetical protein